MSAAKPRLSEAHLVETHAGQHLFVADGSRLFDVDRALFDEFEAALAGADTVEITALLKRAGLANAPLIDDAPLAPPPIHALSLAVAQKCNLGCTYCYAQQGEFGGAAKNMPLQTALQSVEHLIAGAAEVSNTGGVLTGNGADAYKYGVASSLSQSATTILDRFINIPPTITIREGHRVKVYISQDLLLPAYENHTMASTF